MLEWRPIHAGFPSCMVLPRQFSGLISLISNHMREPGRVPLSLPPLLLNPKPQHYLCSLSTSPVPHCHAMGSHYRIRVQAPVTGVTKRSQGHKAFFIQVTWHVHLISDGHESCSLAKGVGLGVVVKITQAVTGHVRNIWRVTRSKGKFNSHNIVTLVAGGCTCMR